MERISIRDSRSRPRPRPGSCRRRRRKEPSTRWPVRHRACRRVHEERRRRTGRFNHDGHEVWSDPRRRRVADRSTQLDLGRGPVRRIDDRQARVGVEVAGHGRESAAVGIPNREPERADRLVAGRECRPHRLPRRIPVRADRIADPERAVGECEGQDVGASCRDPRRAVGDIDRRAGVLLGPGPELRAACAAREDEQAVESGLGLPIRLAATEHHHGEEAGGERPERDGSHGATSVPSGVAGRRRGRPVR